jgi:hypothetical protein
MSDSNIIEISSNVDEDSNMQANNSNQQPAAAQLYQELYCFNEQ